jgi:uncharacterized sulfatase
MRLTLLWIALLPLIAAAADSPLRPNLIVIYADDLGWGDLACYGHKTHRTPNLDRMAREGARFTQFYSACGFCAPSRASLMTGRYPFRHTLTTNPAPDAGINDAGLPASQITLARPLKVAGYATACVGKWHLGHKPEFYPTRHGFDEYFGILYSNDMRPVQLMENEQVAEYPVVQANLTRRYTARAVDFIQRHRQGPFFLYLPHAMPHKPLAVSEEYYRALNSKSRRSAVDLYADVITELDASVGTILRTLAELNLDRRTLVVFSSDNGPWFGGSTGGLRGMKGSTWEGGVRVPMIAWMPGSIPAGRTVSHIAATVDIMPTALHLAGLKMPDDYPLDGRNLWPALTIDSAPPPHEFLYFMSGRSRAVRTDRWKLHVTPPGPGAMLANIADDWIDFRAPDGLTIIAPYEQARPTMHPGITTGDPSKAMMLFDLAADPAEQHDVAAANPQIVAQLKAMYDSLGEPPAATPAK